MFWPSSLRLNATRVLRDGSKKQRSDFSTRRGNPVRWDMRLLLPDASRGFDSDTGLTLTFGSLNDQHLTEYKAADR